MDRDRALKLLRDSNALLEGHFLLTSGNHSSRYIQCAQLLSHPDKALPFMEDLSEMLQEYEFDTVAAPAVGGIIVSYEIGRLTKKRALFLERENGRMCLRRNFRIRTGEKVAVVEDVVTTGGSVLEVVEAVEEGGGVVSVCGALVDRSSGSFNPPVPFFSCIKMAIPIYEPRKCPLCGEGIPFVKPGSRGMK